MKEITISFTAEELRELAKQLCLASYMTIGFPYDNKEMALDIFNRVCTTGFLEAPELGAFGYGGFAGTASQISHELDQECDPVVEQFEANAVEEILPNRLAQRDFVEKHGQLGAEEILMNSELRRNLRRYSKNTKTNLNGMESCI
jgi:hypothetical protein